MHNLEIDEKNLSIAEEGWIDLIKGKETVGSNSVVFAATEFIKRGGAFMIYRDGTGIIRRFDRVNEFEAYMSNINEQRKLDGIEPLSS